ncbi:MAG: winged helix-turn-helix transcriptional regulator [Herminiimonas sp.]|jgi:DNA-binding MarR family transcriptional regulator|nr:winged helix-turn-helix transcriptional regulator [Herminiimonas sp.]MDB5854657.1 winged helix-turn-helix transcriptional regulator [Herminiimonas sp.]
MTDSTEQLQVLQQLGRTYRAFMAAYEKEVGHFLPRWRVLLHLYTLGGPCTQRQLGEASHMDAGALSRQLSALETLGWIARRDDPQDKRMTQVSLTGKGRLQVEKGLPRRAAFIERNFGDIPQDRLHALRDALHLLESRFDSGSQPKAQKK